VPRRRYRLKLPRLGKLKRLQLAIDGPTVATPVTTL
jgi:hypothetical protein